MNKKILLIICPISLILIIFTLGYILTPCENLNKPNMIYLYDESEQHTYTYNHNYQGDYVLIKDVSNPFIETLINTEDKHYYSHHGFDIKRIIKSIFDNFKNNSLSFGASTISQQLAKNIYLNNERSFIRKLKEAFLALKLELHYSKDYILELYINNIYFAHNVYGLKSASEFYFHKQPSELNYQDSCLLVGVINAPNIYSPLINYSASYQKMKSIAYNLFMNNIIDGKQYFEILLDKIKIYGSFLEEINLERYYHQAVQDELKTNNIKINNHKGLIIKTYLDYNVQKIIEDSIKDINIEEEVVIIVMKPYSSEVIGLIGGKDFATSEFNRAIYSNRQIGSTIKPLIYYLALEQNISPLNKFMSKPTTFVLENGETYAPKNASNIYPNREINMIEALAMSDNIYAVKTTLLLGSNYIATFINNILQRENKSTLAISLGGYEMTPLELISIYNAFASEGVYYKPHFIKEVRSNNITIYNPYKKGKRIFKYQECILMNYMLKSPFDRGLITYSNPTMINYQIKNTFACKTGTTNSSSWCVGFNQDYTVLTYIGNDYNNSLKDYSLSKKIFSRIVNTLLLNKKDCYYSYPSNLYSIKFYNPFYSTYSDNYLIKK